MKIWTVAETEAGVRVDAWLALRPEIGSRGRARTAIEHGKVFLNGDALDYTAAGTRVAAGDEVGYWEDRPGSARTADRDLVSARPSLHIVYEDAVLLAVDKPPGWLVEPLPGQGRGEVTLLDLVRDHLRASARRPSVVHRIDRDTSGLVLFATTTAARDHLKEQFERRTPERLYLAVVHGVVSPRSGTWRDHLVWDKTRLVQKRAHAREERGKEAVARYRVIEQQRRTAVIEVSLVTGKRNQIRVQAGVRGYPLVGERIYTFGRQASPADPAFGRQALHAATLGIRHPVTGSRLQLDAPLPHDMRGLIERLRDES